MKLFHTAAFFSPGRHDSFLYPPSVALLLHPFFPLSSGLHSYLLLILATAALASAGLSLALVKKGIRPHLALLFVLTTLVCSYPLLIEFQTANAEIFVWITTMAAIWALREKKDIAAAILIGLSAALKIYPIFFVAIFLSQRKYRLIAVSIATCAAAWLGSLAILGPSIAAAYHGNVACMADFVFIYARHLRGLEAGVDHSIVGVIKSAAWATHRLDQPISWINPYLAFGGATATILYFKRLQYLPVANQLIVLSIFSVVLPPVSYDYTLLNLYAPWAVLMLLYANPGKSIQPLPGKLLSCGFAIVFTEFGFAMVHGHRMAGVIRCLVLLAMVVIALRWPLEDAPQPSLAHA